MSLKHINTRQGIIFKLGSTASGGNNIANVLEYAKKLSYKVGIVNPNECPLDIANQLKIKTTNTFLVCDNQEDIKQSVRDGFSPILISDDKADNYTRRHCHLISDDYKHIIPILTMDVEVIDINNWNHKGQFNNFVNYTNPTFSLGVELDVTNVLNFTNDNNLSFFATFTFLVSKCINKIPELRTRIEEDGSVIQYPNVDPSYVVIKDDKSIVTSLTRLNDDFMTFHETCLLDIQRSKNSGKNHVFVSKDLINSIYISCIPWVKFNSFSNPYNYVDKSQTSIPRITWSKYEEKDDRYYIQFDVSVHHGLVDGYQLSLFINSIIDAIKNIDDFLKGGIKNER